MAPLDQDAELELFEVFFRQNYEKLYYIASSITKDKELSKDAVQLAFLQAYRRMDQLRDSEKFPAWVTTIIVNQAKNLLKSSARLKVIPISDIPCDIKATPLVDSFEDALLIKDQVERILNVLSVEDSEILVLRYYSDLTLQEIASILKIPISNVKIRLHRAKANFRMMLSTEDEAENTQNKTQTINNNYAGNKPPTVNNLGSIVDKETTLEDAQKSVYFNIAEPRYLPPGTKPVKVMISSLGSDVNRITINYDFQGQLLIFRQQNTASTVSQGLLYDTDDTVNKDITINGTPATLLEQKSGAKVLTWYERGLLLELTGQLPTDEFIKIAESIS